MNLNLYKKLRIATAFFIAFIVSVATTKDSYLLAIAGVVVGMIFMVLVRNKAKIVADEREKTLQEKASRMTYAIIAPTLALCSFLFLFPTKSGLSVFSKGEFAYLESIGYLLAYLTLMMLAIYSVSYHFYNKKYGGGGYEE